MLGVSRRRDHGARRPQRHVRLARARRRRSPRRKRRDREAQAAVTAQARRHPAAPDRRARRGHRPQAVRDGPRRPRRAADDAVPPADDQRQRAVRAQPRSRPGDARDHRRRDHPAHELRRTAASPSAARRSASASTRSTRSNVVWGAGHRDGKSDDDVLADLQSRRAATDSRGPAHQSARPARSRSTSGPGDPLETNCAVADVTAGSAEIWSSLKSPIWAQEQLATILGMPVDERSRST